MQYIKELSQYHSDRDSAVTFGKFDGLHRGHQKLVRKVQELSTNENVNSIVCAFDMHPLWKEKGITPQLIMDQRERYLHLETQVDVLICLRKILSNRLSAGVFTPDMLWWEQISGSDMKKEEMCRCCRSMPDSMDTSCL